MNFDDRLERYLFFFVIIWCLIIVSAQLIDSMVTGKLGLPIGISHLFFGIIPLIMAYTIPWKRKEDMKFDTKEAKIVGIYLGFVILCWSMILMVWDIPHEFLLNTNPYAIPPTASVDLFATIWWFLLVLPAFILTLIRRQSMRSLGITSDNLGRSMALMMIPFTYLLYCIISSAYSLTSILAAAIAALVVGISEEFIWRGFSIFRLEPLGNGMAVLITSVLFAAVHGPEAFPFIIIDGLSWGLILLKTRNILPLILLHMFADIAGVI